MQEKVKEIIDKVLVWWNKFLPKQKTIIIGIAAATVFTFAILIYIFTKPQYTLWRTCETSTESAEIKEILDGADIKNEVSEDALRIKVLTKQIGEANLILGASGYLPDDWDAISKVTNGGFSKTEADKQREMVVYKEKQLESAIETYSAVKKADVLLDIPSQKGTLIANKEESSAYVQLTLRDYFTADQAATVARAVATALGSKTTAKVVIVDSEANLLFSGEEDTSILARANSELQLRAQAQSLLGTDVKKIILGTQLYDLVEVSAWLDMDFASYEEAVHEYYVEEGREQGPLSHEELDEAENSGGTAAIPGTDSNNENGHLWQTGDNTESSESHILRDYLPSEYVKKWITTPGNTNYAKSSAAIACISYKVVKQEDAKRQGFLDGISWEEYKLANSGRTKMDVDPDLYGMIANATGMSEDKITVMAYEEYRFIDAEGLDVNTTDVLSIVLIIIIIALLALVVVRSMTMRKEVSEAEELSVEDLLQSTPEAEIEDIEVETKSETRKMIEKFVDDNPEAAAKLLRNWLNEEWG